MKTIKQYIEECNKGIIESGMYTSKDEDGKELTIALQKGVGAQVTSKNNKGWYEVVEYDNDGNQVSVSYEK